jgi:5-methylcytosine-specific restriction endonuclease McrA
MSKAFAERRRSGASRPELNKAAWQRIRKTVRQRDGNCCRSCGTSGEWAKLSVHHLLPASLGGTDDMDNLLTLCHRCHAAHERAARTLTFPIETPPARKRGPQPGNYPHGARFRGPDGRPWSRHWFDY